MNKLAAINLAVEEINKQAFIGAAFRGLSSLSRRAGQGIVNRFSKPIARPPPVVSAGGAAASAQKPGLLSRVANNPYAIGTAIGAPLLFQAGSSPLPQT